jgi:hypothetical protein
VLVAALLGVDSAACERQKEISSSARQMSKESTKEEIPRTREGFLAELAPQPGGDLFVAYDVKGPAGIAGSLELVTRAGGYRRETWSIVLQVDGQEDVRIEGVTIQTPERVWTGVGNEPGVVTTSPLHALADAYLTLQPVEQARVVASLRAWHADLAKVRAKHPGEVKEILGVRCLWLQIAAQHLCLWEEMGIPLRYRGRSYSLEATRLERESEVSDHIFVFPERARTARTAPLAGSLVLDPVESLRSLANGDYAPMALMLQPGLRIPLRQPEEP